MASINKRICRLVCDNRRFNFVRMVSIISVILTFVHCVQTVHSYCIHYTFYMHNISNVVNCKSHHTMIPDMVAKENSYR